MCTISWADLGPQRSAVRYTYHKSPEATMDWSSPQLRLTSQKTKVNISSSYFARGAMREARCMYDKAMDLNGVAKVYFNMIPTRADLEKDMEAQAISKLLALEFSALNGNGNDNNIDFIFTSFYELTDLPDGHAMKYFAYEPYMKGDYKKYSNNNGWVNPDFDPLTSPLGAAANSFSHFTWQHTLGNMVVVDLQGVSGILTDPQIHCRDVNKYGKGNLGKEGLAAFFSTHVCSDSCARLGLIAPKGSGGDTHTRTVGVPAVVKPTRSGPESEKDLARKMELSCTLCGSFHSIQRREFLNAFEKGIEVMCPRCTEAMADKTSASCIVPSCRRKVMYSVFWYVMKGMEPPKTCRECKKKARAEAASTGSTPTK